MCFVFSNLIAPIGFATKNNLAEGKLQTCSNLFLFSLCVNSSHHPANTTKWFIYLLNFIMVHSLNIVVYLASHCYFHKKFCWSKSLLVIYQSNFYLFCWQDSHPVFFFFHSKMMTVTRNKALLQGCVEMWRLMCVFVRMSRFCNFPHFFKIDSFLGMGKVWGN